MNIRLNRQQRDTLDRSASYLGKNRSDFVLEVACREDEYIPIADRLYDIYLEELRQEGLIE